MIATMIDYQKSILPFPVVGRCRNRPDSVSSFWAWSKTPDLPLELSSYLFSGLGVILPFPVVGHCRNHLATLYSGSPSSKMRAYRWNFDAVVVPVV